MIFAAKKVGGRRLRHLKIIPSSCIRLLYRRETFNGAPLWKSHARPPQHHNHNYGGHRESVIAELNACALQEESDEEVVAYRNPTSRWRSPSPADRPRSRSASPETKVRFSEDQYVDADATGPRVYSEKISPEEKSLFWDQRTRMMRRRKVIPKDFKSDSKSRTQMFRRSLLAGKKALADAYQLERVIEHDLDGLFTKVEIRSREDLPKSALKSSGTYLDGSGLPCCYEISHQRKASRPLPIVLTNGKAILHQLSGELSPRGRRRKSDRPCDDR